MQVCNESTAIGNATNYRCGQTLTLRSTNV